MENIDFMIILTTAFLGGMGHCIGMCGGIVVAYTSTKIEPKSSWIRQSSSHLAYNFGRVVTYSILGAIFGLLGKTIAFTPQTKGVLFLLTGVLMILAGLSLVGNLKFLNSAEFSISKNGWYQNSFRQLITSKTLKSFFLLGMLNGIIPCGLVYSFAVIAASTASIFWGAAVMAVFGLATIPALFFLATVTRFLQQGSLRQTMMRIAALLVVLYGAITIYKGYNFIANPEIMKKKMEQMHHQNTIPKTEQKCGGQMKCTPGKCG